MPSFSKTFTTLSGMGFGYLRDSHHAAHTFNQNGLALYQNNPRFPFEYYVNINLNKSNPTVTSYIGKFLNNVELSQVMPLVKSVDMPAIKIQTDVLNQYNRRRLNQTKVDFEPVKMVFHDVADGKTLRFWEMYYRYYFLEGNEYGKNAPKDNPLGTPRPFGIQVNKDILGLPSATRQVFDNLTGAAKVVPKAQNQYGEKSDTENIVSETLNNHNFGYNLELVANVRQLISSIEIVMFHGGRYNKVVLVNPKISAFSQDQLSYSESGKTSELTMVFEYEYAYYEVENKLLSDVDKERFKGAEILELPALSFNSRFLDFLEQNNVLMQSDNPILQKIGKNVQSAIGEKSGQLLSEKVVRSTSSSVLNGMAKIDPKPIYSAGKEPATPTSFASKAVGAVNKYSDVFRIPK